MTKLRTLIRNAVELSTGREVNKVVLREMQTTMNEKFDYFYIKVYLPRKKGELDGKL